jgi:hypothetical protein
MCSFIYGSMKTRPNYESTWLKIAAAQQLLWKFFCTEFQQFLRKSLSDRNKSPFIVLCKPGFIADQYGRKTEFLDKI